MKNELDYKSRLELASVVFIDLRCTWNHKVVNWKLKTDKSKLTYNLYVYLRNDVDDLDIVLHFNFHYNLDGRLIINLLELKVKKRLYVFFNKSDIGVEIYNIRPKFKFTMPNKYVLVNFEDYYSIQQLINGAYNNNLTSKDVSEWIRWFLPEINHVAEYLVDHYKRTHFSKKLTTTH